MAVINDGLDPMELLYNAANVLNALYLKHTVKIIGIKNIL